MFKQEFLDRAIKLSELGVSRGDGGPFGAVVVRVGKIIAEGNNMVLVDDDPTAHAEMVVMRRASKALGNFDLADCEIYTSCEPCPMCLGAIYWARPKAVYYANTRDDAAIIGFDDKYIYDQLAQPIESRDIPFVKIDNTQAIKAFKLWQDKSDKTPY